MPLSRTGGNRACEGGERVKKKATKKKKKK